MKIVVTGHNGNIGKELVKRGVEPLLCNVSDRNDVYEAVKSSNPDVIINCAAMTDIKWCEEHPRDALNVNTRGPGNLALSFNGVLIQLSSDHIFDGKRGNYTEKEGAFPINIYGNTKLAGEYISQIGMCKTRVVRTSKLFDYSMTKSDIQNMLLGQEHEYTNIIFRSFLYIPHFVDALLFYIGNCIGEEDYDVIHIAGTKIYSYYGLWVEIAKEFGCDPKLIVPRNHEIPESPRPYKGGLNVSKARKMKIPLHDAVDGIKEIHKLWDAHG